MRSVGSIVLLTGLALGQAEETAPIVERPITRKDRDHWAWRPLGQAAIPQVPQAKRLANPVDHFIAARLQPHQLTLAPEADHRTLIRRLYFDLLCLLYTSPSPRDYAATRMPSSA